MTYVACPACNPSDKLMHALSLPGINDSLAPVLLTSTQELYSPKQSLTTVVPSTSTMRVQTTSNPWHTLPHHSALTSIGTHSLWASVSGPIRTPNSPLLIFFTGAGASVALYTKLQQALSSHIRCLFYDRAGYDQR